MTDNPQDPSKLNEEIPTFRISPKKVDDSWKEEVRREQKAADATGGYNTPSGKSINNPDSATKAAVPREVGKTVEAPQSALSAAEQQQSKIFMTFIAGLAQQALMQLGEIESPFTGQREVDLQGARYSIELLSILQIKTKGNLTKEEAAALTEALRDLKMRYIEIANEMQRQMAAQIQKSAKGGK
ncbi:MAG: DUF1844 domain-containing protein [Planctomycetota bacterium]